MFIARSEAQTAFVRMVLPSLMFLLILAGIAFCDGYVCANVYADPPFKQVSPAPASNFASVIIPSAALMSPPLSSSPLRWIGQSRSSSSCGRSSS